MSKQSGLGERLYIGTAAGLSYDLSADITAIDKAAGGPKLLDATSINDSAPERIGGIRSGDLSVTGWWDTAVGQEHPVFSALPPADVFVVWLASITLADVAACLDAKQINYDPKRAGDGALTVKVDAQSTGGVPLEWGIIALPLTTDVAAVNNRAPIDFGVPAITGLTISGNTVANPTVVTTTAAHGLATGDSVNIATSNSTPSINGDYTVTVLTSTTFTIPVNVTVSGTAGTVIQTSKDFGAAAWAFLTAFTGTSMTPVIQDSADNVTFATLANLTPTAMTATAGAQRAQGLNTDIVRRYVRANSTGTFTVATWACVIHRPTVKEW